MTGIGADGARRRVQAKRQVDVLADQSPQHLLDARNQIVQYNDLSPDSAGGG